jgi:hypothetical protein
VLQPVPVGHVWFEKHPTAAFHILHEGVPYRDLGSDHFVQRDRSRVAQRLARRIRDLGYEVTINQAA